MLGPLKRFWTISPTGGEGRAVDRAMFNPLSGYLAGKERSDGYFVTQLEELWQDVFRVKHAIAVNSCTSGLLAACAVSGVNQHSTVVVPAITMSATAAVPKFLGAKLTFGDVDGTYFCLTGDIPEGAWTGGIRAIIATNLFGHPAPLALLRSRCDEAGITLIEDNAQAILAMEDGHYTGTIGHIGCFSLNVHKHLQCGEGGVICTNDDGTAHELRGFINHGENMGLPVGLNLRMPELCAAVALAQLERAEEIVGSRVEQAKKLIAATRGSPGIAVAETRDQCSHSFYHVAWRMPIERRNSLMKTLNDAGLPVRRYVGPLYHMQTFWGEHSKWCTEAEKMYDEVFIFENCAWDLTDEQIEKVGELFHSSLSSS